MHHLCEHTDLYGCDVNCFWAFSIDCCHYYVCSQHYCEIKFFLRDGNCKLKKDIAWILSIKSTLFSNDLVTKHYIICWYMGNCLDHMQQFSRISWDSCFACLFLQSIDLEYTEEDWRSVWKGKRFKWDAELCQTASKLSKKIKRNNGKVSVMLHTGGAKQMFHIYQHDQMQVGTICKAIFLKTLIKSQYLVSPGQSIQHYVLKFMPMNMNIVFTS